MAPKAEIHALINEIEDESLMQDVYKLLSQWRTAESGSLWNELDDDQKSALMLSYEQSKVSRNLIDHEKIRKRFTKWLNN